MPIAWYICPYKRRASAQPERYCAMDDFTAQILADGGRWAEAEVLGDCAIVKVSATSATLQAINVAAGFSRIPLARLDDPLSSLTATQRQAIKDRILAMGYPLGELLEAMPDLSTVTLRDVLRFITRRRLRPRYDSAADQIVLDGSIQPVRPVEDVDTAVS